MRDGLPGGLTRRQRLERVLRVDHAGEYGAKRIYEGQLAVMGRGDTAPALRMMAQQEERHLAYFEKALPRHQVRPSALHPLWHIGGFLVGAGSAILGKPAAMACTVAVETVIDDHYARQITAIEADHPDLAAAIGEFQAEEREHRDIGLAQGAEDTPAYPVFSFAIRAGTRLAIWLAGRL